MSAILTYPEAIILGAFQGVTELFPVSSLGHSVLIPAIVGGSWKANLDVTAAKSPYLAFIVGMHVATAIAMIIYFWRDWLRIIKGFFGSFGQITSPAPGTGRFEFRDTNQKLAWMIILGTIPVGIAGVILDHPLRTVLAKPTPTAIFLALNGVLLFGGEIMRRRRAGLDAQQALAGQQATGAVGAPSGLRQGSVGRGSVGQGSVGDQGWDARQEYRDQSRYGEVGYGDQAGYGGRPGYQDHGYDDRGGYAGQGYGDRGGYQGQDGYGNQAGYDQRGYAGHGDPDGQHPNDPRHGNRGGYDQGDFRDQGRHGDQRGHEQPGGYGDPRHDPWAGDPRQNEERDYRRGGYDQRAPGQGGRHRAQQYPPEQYPPQQQPPQQHQAGEYAAPGRRPAREHEADLAVQADHRLSRLSWLSALALGACQILALFPGFSRDGSVMVGGLARGLSRQDAVRFSFLLSAPVILAAGVFKASELLGPETKGIHGPILAGMLVSGVCAYLALWFLDRLLSNPKRTLTPFAIYCLIAGILSLFLVA